MIVKMNSGEKELKFGHRAIYNLKKDTGKELFELVDDLVGENISDIKITTLYDLLYAALKPYYENIELMLDDLKDNELESYINAISESVGKLLGASF